MTAYQAIAEAVAAVRTSAAAMDADFAQVFPGRAERYPGHAHHVAVQLARRMTENDPLATFEALIANYSWVYDKIHAYLHPPQEPTP
jgi:hypothetical protein